MDIIGNLAHGFGVALSVTESAFRADRRTDRHRHRRAAGHRPGGDHLAAAADHLRPAGDRRLIMLAGIYYGAQYGGSTTAILLNLPGEISSVVTALDGYQMARNGRAGAALATSALGSFFAGTVATRHRRRLGAAADLLALNSARPITSR